MADPNSPPSRRAVAEGERLTTDAPHDGGRHAPGNALPPPPQRATPACKGARCGAGAGSARPHRPHPGHTGRGTPATRPRGRTAGGGTAPDTRRPSQQWQTTPPGDAPPHPHGTQPPQGVQAKGTVLGSHTHTPAPTARGGRTHTARPVGGQSGEGERLTSDAPRNGGRHPEAGSDPRGHLGVTWGVYLCAGKPPLADIILSHPPDLTRCDSVIGLVIPAMSGHIQYRGDASGDLYIGISGINRVLLS